MRYVETVEYQDNVIRLVKLGGVRQSPRFPLNHSGRSRFRKIDGRRITKMVVHQSLGSFRDGHDAVDRLARFMVSPPRYEVGPDGNHVTYPTRSGGRRRKRIGGGRGWPGIGYTFVIPTRPAVVDGLLTVYRIWDDEWITWHTKGHNADGVGICMVGTYRSRHVPSLNKRAWDQPDRTALVALDHLVDYLASRYQVDLGPDTLFGHSDAGKPACPGDALERWIEEKRESDAAVELAPQPMPREPRPLETWKDRQQALVDLGYDVGPAGVDGLWGNDTRSAVEAFQECAGIKVDGVWGPITEDHIRRHLALL